MSLEMNKNVADELDKAVQKALTMAGELVVSQAKALAPVDTGKLRDDIYYEVEGNEVHIGSPTEYAEAVEYRPGGKPFMRPAFRESKSKIEHIVGQEIRMNVGGSK